MTGAALGALMTKGNHPGKLLAGASAGAWIGAGISHPVSKWANKWLGLPENKNALSPQANTLMRKINPAIGALWSSMNNIDAFRNTRIIRDDMTPAQQIRAAGQYALYNLTPLNNNPSVVDPTIYANPSNWDLPTVGFTLAGFWMSTGRKQSSYIIRQQDIDNHFRGEVYRIMGHPGWSEKKKLSALAKAKSQYIKVREDFHKDYVDYLVANTRQKSVWERIQE